MKTDADLNLAVIRDAIGLDFARHTYNLNQCTCCYGPLDMTYRCWRGGLKAKRAFAKKAENNIHDYTYVLFKNASNMCNHNYYPMKDNEMQYREIIDGTCIAYRFKDNDQKISFCQMLQEQLGDEYIVEIPETDNVCIEINLKEMQA